MIARTWLAIVFAVLAVLAAAAPARAWDDATGSLDMPWLGGGGRARLFSKTSFCMMCPTGSSYHRSWGATGASGGDPYSDVAAAFRYLKKKGIYDAWPEAIGEGTIIDGSETIEPRAVPYRFTIVMLQPMVVVMRFDLGALVKVGDYDSDQSVGTPWMNQAIEFGTKVPATGTLLWFSPDADQVPTPVAMTDAEHGAIAVQEKTLALERHGNEWLVRAPQRTEPAKRR
jgi:hypothetical protein